MAKLIPSLALLGLSTPIGLALGQDLGGLGDSLYGGHSLLQPGATRTVTMTHVSTVTVGQNTCNAVYVPTTITVYTGCSSVSGVSSVSGFPISSQSSRGPWLNTTATGLPCTHGLPTSTALTAPGNMSTPISWNQTTLSRPALTGTVGTTIQTADPIGTSSESFPWRNSTQTSTEWDSTSTLTLTLTSSTVVTVNMTFTSRHSGPTAPGSDYGTGTGLPGHSSTAVSSYQPSLTYQTTAQASSNSATHHTSRNGTVIKTSSTAHTSTWTVPPGWSISTVSTKTKTSTHVVPGNSSILTSTLSTSSGAATSTSIDITTESNDPIFTTSASRSSSTQPWSNTTSTSAPRGWNTTASSLLTLSTLLTSPSSTSGDGNGDQYGSYTYGAPSPSTAASHTSAEAGISSVDPIGGTSTRTSASMGISTRSSSTTVSSSVRPSTFSTHTVGSGITGTSGIPAEATASQPGGGYGYYGENAYRVGRD